MSRKIRFGQWTWSIITLVVCYLVLNVQQLSAVASGPGQMRSVVPETDIVLITIDALRFDGLGCNGNNRYSSPNLDFLSRRGALFEHMITTSPLTHSSVASILTGLFPLKHGSVVYNRLLDEQNVTLAEILKRSGYATCGYVCNPWLDPRFGFGQGFDDYTCSPTELTSRTDHEKITNKLSKHLNSAQPFLFWLHYLDPHSPYQMFRPYLQKCEVSYTGPFMDEFSSEQVNTYKDRSKLLARGDLEHVRLLYESEIYFCDRKLVELFRLIAQSGRSPLIIVTSDHGEEFQEHLGAGHDHTLFDELVRVPLIMSQPGRIQAGTLVRTRVQTTDIVPTVLGLVGSDTVFECDGRPIMPLFEAEDGTSERPSFSSRYFIYPDHHLFSLRQDRWKLHAYCSYQVRSNQPKTPARPFINKVAWRSVETSDRPDFTKKETVFNNDLILIGQKLRWQHNRLLVELLWRCHQPSLLPSGLISRLTLSMGSDEQYVFNVQFQPIREQISHYPAHCITSYDIGLPELARSLRSIRLEMVPRTAESNLPVSNTSNRTVILFQNSDGAISDKVRNWGVEKRKSRFLLFDLEADPLEQNDLSQQFPDILERMVRELDAFRVNSQDLNTSFPKCLISDDVSELLHSLGYVLGPEENK